MPTNRFQFSDDFTLNNGNVGINSATPQTKLDVVGVVKGDNLKVTGVSTFTTYEGFLNSNQNIVENTTISGGGISGSLSGEIIVGTGITVTVASGTTSSQGNVDSLKVYNTFTVPVGGTADRPPKPTPGQLFFNRDFATMEFWDGDRWKQVDNTTQRGRGVFGGGLNSGSPAITTIDAINLSTGGNSSNFGVLTTGRRFAGGCSSSTRGLFGGGNPPDTNIIDYITIASFGNAIDFGDLTVARVTFGASSSTRGLFFGGTNVIDYVQINTLGNALDFGDMIASVSRNATCASSTRAISAGGNNTGLNTIEFVTISSTGNSVFFGNLSQKMGSQSGCSNSIRGIFAGGYNSPSGPFGNNTIEYITIASTGNSIDFGDLTYLTKGGASCTTSTRAIFAGGYNPTTTSYPTKIDFVTISSLGNAQNFGDLTLGRQQFSGVSDSHGGLGGF